MKVVMMTKPWISGPKELLVHGLEHMNKKSDFDRRMALICIDNSVELSMKTFLGLPARITGIQNLSKSKYDLLCENFSKLLDGIEEYCKDKVTGIDTGDLEWFHRLRNEIYHKGNGITIERAKLESYAEIAIILFQNLFETELKPSQILSYETLVGRFTKSWIHFEKNAIDLLKISDTDLKGFNLLNMLKDMKYITKYDFLYLKKLYSIRNSLIYDDIKIKHSKLEAAQKRIKELTQKLK